MAQGRRITLAAINIALHAPHSGNSYIQLIQKAFKRRQVIRLGSLHGALLGLLSRPYEEGNGQFLAGEIYRFVKLDAGEPWFNAETREPATEDDVGTIKIPGHLLPHLQRIPFVFNVRRHQVWYVAKDQKNTFSPSIATKFFDSILQSTALLLDFPEVSVTAVPDSSSVETILTLPNLEYLRIELVRPNPDDGESAEARWLRKLEEQNATKAKLELFHAKNSFVEPDSETREMAGVAAQNGLVYGRGRSADGLPLEDSTKDRPLLQHEYVNTETETVANVLQRSAA